MYKPTDTKTWTGRIDEEDGKAGFRWHQVVQLLNFYKEEPPLAGEGDLALLGFASDEGVRRNQGRTGASDAPFFLRKAMSGLAWQEGDSRKLFDAGDVIPSGERLEEAQIQLGEIAGKLIDKGYLPIVLGGGHEVAWASFQGYVHSGFHGKKLGVINFDAHFDLRKSAKASSGTPFWQMALWYKAHERPFDYFCLGIQKHANTRALFQTAGELGVAYVLAQDVGRNSEKLRAKLHAFLEKVDCVYLSIDLDGFDSAFAPGVSAPGIGGMNPNDVIDLIQLIRESGKLLMMDVAELNPSLDHDMRTAKLGARCIFEAVS